MSDLLFSFWLPSFYFSRDSHSGVAELTFSFDSASFFDSASYFGTLFGFDSFFLLQRNRKNCLVFLFSSPSSTEWHMIGFSFSRFLLEFLWPSWTYSVPWKTREGYQLWWKGIKLEFEGRFHEKGCRLMRAFVTGKGSVEVLGSKANGESGEHSWNLVTFTLPLYLWDKGSSFVLSPL